MEKVKDLNYWKNNCEEDYLHTPISVLRYITELENKVEEAINFVHSSLPFNEANKTDFEKWISENCGAPREHNFGHHYKGQDFTMHQLEMLYKIEVKR